MDDEVKEIKMDISLEAMVEDRKGRFANFFTATNSEKVMILDCYFIDRAGETEEGIKKGGILNSRVIMDSDSAIQLRNMLDEHITKSGWAIGNDR